jgi:alpha-amylase
MTHGVMASKFFYSEFFDGNPATLNAWATEPPMSGRSLVADFPVKFAVQEACNGFHARPLDGAGYASWRPDLACTFLDNPDTDTSPGQQVISNKLLGYAFLLTIEGYPFVYGKDYFPNTVWPGAYGLSPWLDNLIWIHEHLANGRTITRFLDDKVIVLNRIGSPGLLTALNFDTLNARPITCDTSFGPQVLLHDYTGRHADIRTDDQGRASFTTPSNAFARGQSYLCFSRAGLDAPNAVVTHETTQTIFGSADLDVAPAGNSEAVFGRITAQKGTAIEIAFRPDRRGWQTDSGVRVVVTDPANRPVLNRLCTDSSTVIKAQAEADGEYLIKLSGRQLPTAGSGFELDVTYTAPQQI